MITGLALYTHIIRRKENGEMVETKDCGVLRWLKGIGVVLLAITWGCASAEPTIISEGDGLALGCAVGDVTAHDAIVWAKTVGSQKVSVQYTTGPFWTTFLETGLEGTSAEQDFTARWRLSGLQPHTRYRYRSIVSGQRPGPPCEFMTAPLPEASVPVTFVLGGDLRYGHHPFSIMRTMQAQEPDFFVFLGDTIYADVGEWKARDLQGYWRKYVENRDEHVQHLLSRTSVYAIWDDHEVKNDYLPTHPLMPVGRQAFFDYWPIARHSQESGRLYRSFQWGKHVEVIILDTRQYRDPSVGTILGEEQKGWLFRRLGESSATFKIVFSSVPVSDPRKDKWGEYPSERDEMLQFIQDCKIPGVLFVAGDVHHGAVSRMPGFPDIKEMIFGPLAAPMNVVVPSDDPRFEFFHQESPNFGKMTVRPDEQSPSVQVEWIDAQGRIIHQVMWTAGST